MLSFLQEIGELVEATCSGMFLTGCIVKSHSNIQSTYVGDPPTKIYLAHYDFPIPEEEVSITELTQEIPTFFPSISRAGNLSVRLGKGLHRP